MSASDTRTNEARNDAAGRRSVAGALLILLLVAGALLVFFSADIVNAFQRTYTIHVVMESAPGLVEDAPVWVSGKPVGTVRSVGFVPMDAGSPYANGVIATLELPREISAQVRADSRVRLTTERLIGTPLVDIQAGTAAAPVLGEGDTLTAAPHATPEELMARAGALRQEMDTVLLAVNRLRPLLSRRMNDAQQSLASAQAAMAEAGRLTTDLRSGAGLAALRDPAFSASLASAQSNVQQLPAMFDRLGVQVAAAGEVGAAVARLRTRADSLNATLAALAARMQDTNGSAWRFQQDSALARALRGAQAQLDSLIAEARSNPLRFVF